ncbi:Choline monooxygenase, chloroplastic [Sesamum angolense]|uniref:Choline monooxygenase, chloroplastic n=1 Tax=Sesamum angolense TaxID=2727404 RepID=A0AAE1WNU7_9LAMI|nr:Choline monooxygenase, chloroplastic [Sesamum angolense]
MALAATMMLPKLASFGHCPEIQHPYLQFSRKNPRRCHTHYGNSFPVKSSSMEGISGDERKVRKTRPRIQPQNPIEEALYMYVLMYFLVYVYDGMFMRSVGYTEQVKEPHEFFTGRLGSIEYVVCRDDKGTLYAFHNVCRHHASLIASGTGKTSCFVCPYHVFCDNYLDGGYHVPYAHRGLASGLQLDSYSTKMYENVSIQSCGGSTKACEQEFDRLGSKALYAFVYPNFMINRYGPWMDTNLVLPLGPRKCQVIFDYFLDASLKDDSAFIEKSLEHSEKVQDEDIILCKAVQQGLESPAYEVGRYSPTVEMAMHHFHCLLHKNLSPVIPEQ